MKWASAISDETNHKGAIEEATARVKQSVADPQLVLLFVSPHFATSFTGVLEGARTAFPNAAIVGCSGGGIIGEGVEVEARPAVSVTAAELPGVQISRIHLEDVPESGDELSALLGMSAEDHPVLVVLPDPFTCPADDLIQLLDGTYPGAVKIGGLASGGTYPGSHALFLDDYVHHSGALVLALAGNIQADTIIAQGCRPIGNPMLITRCEGNILFELGSRPALDTMKSLYESLGPSDRELFGTSLFVGIEMKDQVEYHAGDFLVRNIVGFDPKSGAVAIAAEPKQWQAMQFHLRDARTSREDLVRMLDRYRAKDAMGALLFSCVGRGVGLYGEQSHDSREFRERIGDVPLGGFFCNGEIGPIGGTTFLHGYTSAFAVFRPKVD
jgi:small ligand-binding sensory domain FIST